MGCPIRKFTDQSLFAAPHDLSQRTTSFIASQHQGIHRILLRHLIALIIDALPSVTALAVIGRAVAMAPRRDATRPCAKSSSGLDLRTTPTGSSRGPNTRAGVRSIKTSLLQPHPRTRRSSTGPLTEDAKTSEGKNARGRRRPTTLTDPDATPRTPPEGQVECGLSSRCHISPTPPLTTRSLNLGDAGRSETLHLQRTIRSLGASAHGASTHCQHSLPALTASPHDRGAPLIQPPAPIPKDGGARRDRTDDLMLAKHALSQLSYGPEGTPASTRPPRGAARARREWAARARRERAARARRVGTPAGATTMVGLGRLELPTSRLSSARSNQLSYKPEPDHHRAITSVRRRSGQTRPGKKEKRRRRSPA